MRAARSGHRGARGRQRISRGGAGRVATYRAVLMLTVVSIPIGLLLAHLRAG